MSIIMNTAARQQIGDGANAASLVVTTSATTVSVPAALRGKYVKLYASAGTVYASFNTAATAANGFEITAGTPEQIYIPTSPDNQYDYDISVIGTEAATLKVVEASS